MGMAKPTASIFRPHFGTRSSADAVKFYCSLFGWGFRIDSRGGGTVSLLRGSQEIATCVPPVEGFEGAAGGCYPAFWVPSVVEHGKRASALGARILAHDETGPRPARVLAAPTGEVFALLEGPPEPVLGPDVAWLEVVTPDPSATRHFYGQLLGWAARSVGERHVLLTSERSRFAGLTELHEDWEDRAFLSATGRRGAAEESIPPHWMVYFRVPDLEDALGRVGFLGGTVVARHELEPDLSPAALIRDPAGYFWSLLASHSIAPE
jgi:predicted enzyme related to lactoylglutathione lyase